MLNVICHNIRSRENVGSIFRTADAFGIDKIYLTGITPAPPHPKISKTALGAETWILWEKVFSTTRLIKKLRALGFFVIALEQNRRSIEIRKLGKLEIKKPITVILGNEVTGISPKILKLCDAVADIPMEGKKESLNVSVAFGIAAYIISSKLKTKN